jgi:sulfate adenylyltransferase
VNQSGDRPALALNGARLDALELILSGLMEPINGFCLPGRMPAGWPFESILEIPENLAAAVTESGSLILTDPDGTPLALLIVTATEASQQQTIHIAGALSALQPAEHPPARDIRLSLADVEPSAVAIFADRPDPADVVHAVTASPGQPLLFLAVSWNSGHADYRIARAVDDLRRCSSEVAGSSVRFLALAPLNSTVDAATTLAHVLKVLHPGAVSDFSEREPTAVADVSSPSGCVVLLTGLSGSGKSTVARALAERLTAGGNHRAVLLDGDDVRRVLSPSLGFTASDREENLRRIGWVAAKIASVGGIAICAPIAPFEQTRAEMRAIAEESSQFILIYVSTPLEVCEQRDRKGLYAKARAGEIKDFTGIDSPYETPTDADLVIDTSSESTEQHVKSILRLITTATSDRAG